MKLRVGSGSAERDCLHGRQGGIVCRVVFEGTFNLRLCDTAGVAPARQVVDGGITAATATATHPKLRFEIGKRTGTGSNGFLYLAFGDGITYANKHENNYQLHA